MIAIGIVYAFALTMMMLELRGPAGAIVFAVLMATGSVVVVFRFGLLAFVIAMILIFVA